MKKDKSSYIATWADNTGAVAVCGMAICMTTSRALFNLFALLMVVAWVVSGRFRYLAVEAKQSPAMLFCLLLYSWIVIGVTYSAAPAELAWGQVVAYSKLLLIPLMISFINTPQRTKALWISLTVGLLLLQVSYLADLWIDIPGSRSAKTGGIGVFNNSIVEGLSLSTWALTMAVASAILLKQRSWTVVITVFMASVAIYSVLFLNPGRGAQLALVVSLIVLVFLLAPKTARWAGVFASILIIGALALQSNMMKQRFERALLEAKTADTVKNTSVGLRINAWRTGLSLWNENPLFGHGTGSYQQLMEAQKGGEVGGCEGNTLCQQPHNQYVLLLVEQGVVGLLLFLALLGAMIWPAVKSDHVAGKFSAVFACAFAVHSFFDSGLRMGTQMFVFMVMAVALASAVWHKWPENG
jgi:O-antigen ligase